MDCASLKLWAPPSLSCYGQVFCLVIVNKKSNSYSQEQKQRVYRPGALGSSPTKYKRRPCSGTRLSRGFSVGRGIPGQKQPGILRPETCLVVEKIQPLTRKPTPPCRRCLAHCIRPLSVAITYHKKLTLGNHSPATCAGQWGWDGATLFATSPHLIVY